MARRLATGVAGGACLVTLGLSQGLAADEAATGLPASIAAVPDSQTPALTAEPVWLIQPKTVDLSVGPALQLQRAENSNA